MNEGTISRRLARGLTATWVLLLLAACGEPSQEVVDESDRPASEETAESKDEKAEAATDLADTTPEVTEADPPEGPESAPQEPEAGTEQADSAIEESEPGAELAVDDPARITTISEDLRTLMEETTWEPGCPVEIDELRKLTVRYVDLGDGEQEGELIVHEDVAGDLLGVFAQLYEDRFPIAQIEPIEHFDGDDDASMAANNTSAFNCRPITGSDRWSEHAYGWAVDINPIQNPYVRDGEVLPPEGEPYLDRDDVRAGMVTRPGVVEYFDGLGWGWGGDWQSLKDFMHFSLTGR